MEGRGQSDHRGHSTGDVEEHFMSGSHLPLNECLCQWLDGALLISVVVVCREEDHSFADTRKEKQIEASAERKWALGAKVSNVNRKLLLNSHSFHSPSLACPSLISPPIR